MSTSALLLLALAVWVAAGDGGRARARRLRARSARVGGRGPGPLPMPLAGRASRGHSGVIVASASGAAAILVLAPWPAAPVIATIGVVLLAVVLPRFEPRSVREASRQRLRDLPLALDLLAACWSAGAVARQAAATVADGVGAPLSNDLLDVASRLELGTTASDAWAFLLDIDDDGAARDAYRALIDASTSGVPPVDALRRAAHRSRETRRRAGEAAARTVGVKVAAPLGLCFLPAFVLLAIAPAVLGAVLPVVA